VKKPFRGRKRRSSCSTVVVASALIFFCGIGQANELLFYSSVPRNFSETLVKAFEAKNPDVTVKIFQAGTETLLEKVELEIKGKGHPDADVVWIQEKAAMQRLAERHLLAKYLPAGQEAIDQQYKDPDGYWIATFVTHVILLYNETRIQGPNSTRQLAGAGRPSLSQQAHVR